ncbi:MAG: hypothetical protein KGN84_18700 [Acidobacteriota bacterium]|nr:hypothetical protein [Acidobacteriota bacterium]
MSPDGLTRRELRTLRFLKTPERVQRFLDEDIGYNKEPDGETIRSPRRVLRDRVAHCLEGALLAAAALRVQGFPPLLLDLEAVRDDDHVLAIFRSHNAWGAVAKSNYSGLRFREPVYRTLRELSMSYFEQYFNLAREKTLRGYSRPVNLTRFDGIGWMTSEDDLWAISDHLVAIAHTPLFPDAGKRRFSRVDKRLFSAGLVGRAR